MQSGVLMNKEICDINIIIYRILSYNLIRYKMALNKFYYNKDWQHRYAYHFLDIKEWLEEEVRYHKNYLKNRISKM